MKIIRKVKLNFFLNHLEILSLVFVSFIMSTIFTLIFIKEKIIPNCYSNDHTRGSQKIHNNNIKRIGGLSIVFTIFLMIQIYEIFFELNEKNDLLYIARDFVGVKPLYYFLNNTSLIFSSELKASAEEILAIAEFAFLIRR